MPVAPSFANFKQLSEPLIEKDKKYILVEHPNTRNSRKVRWYETKEWEKLYGKKISVEDNGFDNLKAVRGFSQGPILVLRDIKEGTKEEEWCKKSEARYAVGIGWYFISGTKLPADTPSHLNYSLLTWEEFRDKDDRHMKTASQLAAIISKKEKFFFQ